MRLRRRIGEVLGSGQTDGDSTISAVSWRWRPIHSALALAAVLLVVVGIVSIVLSRLPQALPTNLQAAVITRHDLCAQHAKHVDPKVPQDFALLGPYLRQELHHAVLAANLTKDHWHFRGAAICPVGDTLSAHLVFDQAGRTLSILSLPAASFPSLQNHKTYEGTASNHVVIARREDGAIFCLVSSDPNNQTSVNDLNEILRAHESEASFAAKQGPPIFLTWVGYEPGLHP
jgi:hypothetical protein